MFNLAIIIVFAFIMFAAFLLALGAILFYMKRRASQQRHTGKTGDELDESQASDITATWNLLNPP